MENYVSAATRPVALPSGLTAPVSPRFGLDQGTTMPVDGQIWMPCEAAVFGFQRRRRIVPPTVAARPILPTLHNQDVLADVRPGHRFRRSPA
jgi:hypothetical protein